MMVVPNAYLNSFLPFEAVGLSAAERQVLLGAARAFILAEIREAPLHVRVPVIILSWVFGIWLALTTLCMGVGKAAQMWENMGGMPAKSLTRLLRSLALLVFAEDPLVASKIGAQKVQERHTHFRTQRTRQVVV